MDTKKLLAFAETIRIGSINRAAEELGYTQSGLTYVINSVEQDIGVNLITRTHSGIKLTKEGAHLLPYIQDIITREELFTNEVNYLLNSTRKIIRIGSYSSLVLEWLPRVIEKYKNKHTDVNFEVRTGVVGLTDMLNKNIIDIALCEQSIAGTHKWEDIGEDEMYVAFHESLPLAKEDTISLEMLKDYHIIFPSILTKNSVTTTLSKIGLTYEDQTLFFTEDGSATLSLVEHTRGVSFIAQLYSQECPPGVILMPLEPPIKRRIGVAYTEDAVNAKYIQQFINCLKKNPIHQ